MELLKKVGRLKMTNLVSTKPLKLAVTSLAVVFLLYLCYMNNINSINNVSNVGDESNLSSYKSRISSYYAITNDHDNTGQKVMELPRCQCHKSVPARENKKEYGPKNTTCETETFVRGPGQKVIAFTFYEPVKELKGTENKNDREYLNGIKANLELMKELYGPDWTMRVYYDVPEGSPTMKFLCCLACQDPNLDLCDATKVARLGNATVLYPLVWRFLPVIDVNVDVFLSRDLDSRISPREVAAVSDFLKSDKGFHVMRDHPAHTAYVMGGTWGAKVKDLRKEFHAAFGKLFRDGIAYIPKERGGGYDQVALTRYVWPWAKKLALSHDSYTCSRFSRTTAFPTRRVAGLGNFVGSVVSLNSSIGLDEHGICPVKCRPKDHQDWLYC